MEFYALIPPMRSLHTRLWSFSTSIATCLALLAGALPTAHAGAAAQQLFQCQNNINGTQRDSTTPCLPSESYLGDKVNVIIQGASSDTGFPSAFYIGMMREGRPFSTFVATGYNPNAFTSGPLAPAAPPAPGGSSVSGLTGQWVPMNMGLFQPTETFASADGAPRIYTVTSNVRICSALGDGKFELWAGHGALDMVQRNVIEFMKPRLSATISYEQLMLTRIQDDMKARGNMWNVLSLECRSDTEGGSGSGW